MNQIKAKITRKNKKDIKYESSDDDFQEEIEYDDSGDEDYLKKGTKKLNQNSIDNNSRSSSNTRNKKNSYTKQTEKKRRIEIL